MSEEWLEISNVAVNSLQNLPAQFPLFSMKLLSSLTAEILIIDAFFADSLRALRVLYSV